VTRLLTLLFAFLIATPAMADELRPGYLEFTQTTQNDWTLIWKAPIKAGISSQMRPILPKSCRALGQPVRALTPVALTTVIKVRCDDAIAGNAIGLTDFGASQTDILLRVAPLNRQIQVTRLIATAPTTIIAAQPSRMQVASAYFMIGVEHILFGYDHLLFVVALVLLLGGLCTIAQAVTAFTIAHSITLIGTTLGVFGLPQAPVESVIALSILFLAVEIIKKQPDTKRLSERIPWVVAFVFGLLHGFGFAGALKEIGLPEEDVPTALLTFNLGVEAGQLMILFITVAALATVERFAQPLKRPALITITYVIGITASAWFIERTFA
jgi:hydrogenase/urease accessory protein HupE